MGAANKINCNCSERGRLMGATNRSNYNCYELGRDEDLGESVPTD